MTNSRMITLRTPSKISIALSQVQKSPFVVDEAIELVRHPGALVNGWKPEAMNVEFNDNTWLLPAEYSHLREKWDELHPYEESRPKWGLTVVVVDSSGDDKLRVVLRKTSWKELRSFHEELTDRNNESLFQKALPYMFNLEQSPFPNSAVVHVIAETIDNKIILTKRASHMHYHPGRWSCSFEEGVEFRESKFRNSIFHKATSRGFNEEFYFADEAALYDATILSVICEFSNMNPAVVSYLRIPYTSADVLRHWEKGRTGDLTPEIEDVRFLDGSKEGISDIIEMGVAANFHSDRQSSWHPTSRYRLLLLFLHKYGYEALNRNFVFAI